MAHRVLKKINTKLNLLLRQTIYFNYSSRRLLCNALIEAHFDYGCTSWLISCGKTLKTKQQIIQSKCICFCLGLPPHGHANPSHLKKKRLASAWTPSRTMHFHYCKYWTWIAPYCLSNILVPSVNNYNTRSQIALDIPLCRINKGQKSI